MKRVLITGAGSYLGTRMAAALMETPGEFSVQTLSVRGDGWEAESFSGIDALLHVAGVAHRKETAENASLYDRVNRELALRVARKAKAEGVKQFVLFSSMSVYGLTCGHITRETPEAPRTLYGKSKLMAERDIAPLHGEGFQVAILRPPMIYGRDCPGNYPRLSRLIRRLPLFPKAENQRSMLYVGNLCGFVRNLVLSGQGGLYFPQNRAFVRTDELALEIAKAHGKRLWQPRGLGWLLRLLSPRIGPLGKVFGSLTYDQEMSRAFRKSEEPPFAQTIRQTEGCP